jgi:hypothetical protein
MPRLCTFVCSVLLAFASAGMATDTPPLPAVKVLVEICESGIPRNGDWPAEAVVATESFTEDAFGLFELPQKYISTGVRADRAFPTLVRASARVSLPPGKHRLLLRSRGAARLMIDGRVVLTNPCDQPRPIAVGNAGDLPFEEQVTFLDLGPGYRFAPPGIREAWVEIVFSSEPTTVVVESLLGGLEP